MNRKPSRAKPILAALMAASESLATAKPTPTPWKLDGLTVTGKPYEWPGQRRGYVRKAPASVVARIPAQAGCYVEYPLPTARANGELIVRAVNSHADLIAALRGAVSALEAVHDHAPGVVSRAARISAARVAIAKAEGAT